VHLPDPIIGRPGAPDPEQEALLGDAVGLALLVVLEELAPDPRRPRPPAPVRPASPAPLTPGGAPPFPAISGETTPAAWGSPGRDCDRTPGRRQVE